MSRAFVKEVGDKSWSGSAEYQVVWSEQPNTPEVMHETNDLLDAVRWLANREDKGLELRDAAGVLIAKSIA